MGAVGVESTEAGWVTSLGAESAGWDKWISGCGIRRAVATFIPRNLTYAVTYTLN